MNEEDEKHLQKFIDVYEQEFGIRLEHDVAESVFDQLVTLVEALIKPLPLPTPKETKENA